MSARIQNSRCSGISAVPTRRSRSTSCSRPWHNARTADNYLGAKSVPSRIKNGRSICGTVSHPRLVLAALLSDVRLLSGAPVHMFYFMRSGERGPSPEFHSRSGGRRDEPRVIRHRDLGRAGSCRSSSGQRDEFGARRNPQPAEDVREVCFNRARRDE